MKTVKPNLKKMFNFHTIILVLLVIVVSTLNTHNAEGKFQTLHKHHHHKHNYKHENVLGDSDDESNDDSDKQHELYSQHGHHNQYHHSHHHHHHHQQQQQLQQHLYATTPSLEFTTSSSLPSVSPGQVNGDNEFLINPQQQQELPLTNKDEIYYKTKELKSSSSTTSKPTLSIHLMKLHNHNPKSSNSNSSSKHSETSTNSQREHTHLGHYNRLIPTPLTTPEGKSGIDNNRSQNTATMYSAVAQENENSKWKLAAKDEDTKNINEQAAVVQEKLQSYNEQKPEFHYDRRRSQHNYDDYYSDAENGGDDDDENDVDDEYSEDEGDNDGISYDDDSNLSDRSYARITRSKLDEDYIDDEPYRNELSMQRDAAPGVLTEQKYMDVGNEKAVQQARERYMQEQKRPRTPHELATEHWHRMIQATKCRKPLPRVIPVSNNTSKRYEPYATILHRCGDDTGCCGSTASVCTVKRHEIVMVYVFSYDFNYRKEIEALPMQNHTECHCVNRGSLLHDYMPRDKRSGGSGSYLHHFQRQQKKQQEQQQQYRQSQSQQPLQYHHHQQQLQNMLDCHCPRHFNVFEEDVERHVHLPKPHSVFIRKCRCDCLVNNQTCLRFKHGEEGFSLEDRKCILERNCKPPVCSNGEYNSRVGRCPSYRSHLLQMT